MKALVLYESEHHGNTKNIAQRIAKVLKADLKKAHHVKDPGALRDYDLLGFGSGIYDAGYHEDLLELACRIPRMDKKAFLFSTSGTGLWPFNRLKYRLNRKLEEKGLQIIGEFSCRGWDTNGLLGLIGGLNKGRPGKIDLEMAASFARDLKSKA